MSGETRWTKGPWKLVRRDDDFEPFEIRMGTALKTPGNCRVIHRIAIDWCVEPGDKDFGEGLATLRLIAAAPALYSALEDLLRIADDDGVSRVSLREGIEIMQRARTALARARGETKEG